MKKKITVKIGEVKISNKIILHATLGPCVSVCLYHRKYRIAGIAHISRSRQNDTTQSGRLLKTTGFYYADTAIKKLLQLFKNKHPSIRNASLELIVTGGLNNEGPILETIYELKKYKFRQIRRDINQCLYRYVILDPVHGILSITREKLYHSNYKTDHKVFNFYT